MTRRVKTENCTPISRERKLAADLDLVLIGDFADPGLIRIHDNEIRAIGTIGYRLGIFHVAAAAAISRIVLDAARDAGGEVLPADGLPISAKLVVFRHPERLLSGILAGEEVPLPRIIAERMIAIGGVDGHQADIPAVNGILKSLFGGNVTWAAETEADRNRLARNRVALLDGLWQRSLAPPPPAVNRAIKRSNPVIGAAGPAAATWWRDAPGEMETALGGGSSTVVRVHLPSEARAALPPLPGTWEIVDDGEMGIERFLRGLDFYVHAASDGGASTALPQIAAALAHGLPTILHPSLRTTFGEAAIYAAPSEVPATLRKLATDEPAYWEASLRARAIARRTFGELRLADFLERLIGPPPKPRQPARPNRKRVLFVCSNGIGLGHLTRLLAIARRCPPTVEPVFATMSQGLSIIEQAGYPVEYLPFYEAARYDVDRWENWLVEHLVQIMDFHRANCVVFDGVSPYDGLIEALRLRRNVSAVWVRRGLWRPGQSTAMLDRQRLFNLVIEPGELEIVRDEGPTVAFRRGVMRVPPIRLLDSDEVLSREEAAHRIGLDPDRPAALIQLGAGTNRDIVGLIERALRHLREMPDVQPMIAEWKMSYAPRELFPKVPRLHAFPLSRYFAAFDFSISASGYNSFNEIIAAGLPTIFVSNSNHAMDDQVARARHADDFGAAIAINGHDPAQLKLAIETLMAEEARWVITANCRRIPVENGAAAAAEAIAAVAGA